MGNVPGGMGGPGGNQDGEKKEKKKRLGHTVTSWYRDQPRATQA